jgi:microcystin-dependent protein
MGDNIECLTLNTIVNIIDSSGNKYVFNGLTDYDSNKVFGLAIGNYVFQDISINHPMALLNNDVSNLISYSGDSSKKSTNTISINNINYTYDFYYGDINVSVNGDFSGLSVYCLNDGYMGGENLLKYSEICHKTSTTIQPSNALKCLSHASRVNIITINETSNKYVFNNDLAYNSTIKYGLYNGTYVLQNIPQSHPMAILNYNISGVLTYTGDISKQFIKMIDDISYDFYYGDISINVYGPFGTASITCYNHYENMRIDDIFNYSIFCNPGAIISSPPEISYEFNNNDIIVPQTNSTLETNYYVNYNNTKRPWKLNTSYISHYNELYANESLKQKGDNKDYNFKIDASKNNLRIESVDSNIDVFTHNDNSINFQGKTNFNNNSIFNKSVTFEDSVVSKKTITTKDLIASDISVGILRLSDNLTANIIGNIKIQGSLDVIGQVKDGSGNVVQGSLLNNYTIQNSKLNDSSLNNANINNSLIGFTTPSQAIFTDVSINNLAIENDIIINNNLKLKNIEENDYIYATISSNVLASKYKILNENKMIFFQIEQNNLTFELQNTINNSDTDNKRGLDNYKFYLEKNNKYYFENYDNTTSSISIGLYFKDITNINILQENDIYLYNNKNFYVYDEDKNFFINVLGNFVYADLILLKKVSINPLNYTVEKTFEKVFLYKHDFNLIDKIEIVDNSINTLLTSNYDASFRNLIISSDTSLNQKLFVANDVSFNKKLFVENDVSFNSKLFVANDVSFNKKLFVANDVSFNSKLFVENDVSFNSKLFVANDVSFNSKLFVENDVSFNSKLFVYDSFDVDGLVKLNNNTNSTNFDNGALIVTGGVGIGENLHVGENVTINSTDDSTLSTNGALIVKGGVGIAKNLNVGQNVTINSIDDSTSSGTGSLIVDGGVGIAKKLNVGQNVIINSTDDSASSATGSLIVKGGTGILKNLNVDGDVSLNSNVDISGNLNVLNKVHLKDSENITNFNIQDQNFVVDGSVGITQKLIVGESVSFTSGSHSNAANNGALTVGGGVGIGQNLNVGENLNVTQNVTINSNTSSSNSNTGALKVGGGVGIGENLNVLGTVDIGNLLSTKDINAENILPKTDNTYNLGDSNNKWKQIFLDNSGINIGNSARIIKENNGTISMINTGGFEINGNLSITGQLTIPGENIQSSGQIISQSHIIGTPIGIDGTGNQDREQGLFSSLGVLNESLFQNNITIYKDKKIKFANQQGTNHTDLIDAAFKTIDVSTNSIFRGDLNVNKNLNVGGTFTSNIQSVLNSNPPTLTPQNVFQPLVPPGAVMSFATKGAPQGWLECSGQILSRSSYQNLFDVIGTTWDTGLGDNEFRLPNLNTGYFIKGGDVDGNLNPDTTAKPTNNFNISVEASSNNSGNHAHDYIYYNQGGSTAVYAHNTGGGGWYRNNVNTTNGGRITNYAGDHNHTITTTITTNINDTSTWDDETAPKNVILLYCIKY